MAAAPTFQFWTCSSDTSYIRVCKSGNKLQSTVMGGDLRVDIVESFKKRPVTLVLGDTVESVNQCLRAHDVKFELDVASLFAVHYGEDNVWIGCALFNNRRINDKVETISCIWRFLAGQWLVIDEVVVVGGDASSDILSAFDKISGIFPRQCVLRTWPDEAVGESHSSSSSATEASAGLFHRIMRSSVESR